VKWDPLLALEFLTVIRVRRWHAAEAADLARAQAFYPAVGLVLGGVLLVMDIVLDGTLPAGVLAAVLVAALALATRGLHLDGLADTFDGLLGGRDRSQRLEIMRDPRIGSFGATALVLVLLVKWSAIAALESPLRRPALLLAPTLARYAMVVVVAATPYARRDGLGAGYRAGARGATLILATGTVLVAGVALYGAGGLALALLATGIALGVGWWATTLAGGSTGDVYGAVCELTEAAILLAVVASQWHGWLAPWLVAP
jgi:adenosylcobinamide-GDP ribazoletransferase